MYVIPAVPFLVGLVRLGPYIFTPSALSVSEKLQNVPIGISRNKQTKSKRVGDHFETMLFSGLKYKRPFSMDCRERGSHARGVYPTQGTFRMETARVK